MGDDVAQPAPATDAQVAQLAENQSADGLSENTHTSPAPAPEKTGKGKGLRALRDRIALRRSYSTKQSSLSSPTLLSPSSEDKAADAHEDVSPMRTRVAALERLISGKLVGVKKGGKKTKDVGAAPTAVALDSAPSGSSVSSGPEVEQVLAVIAEAAPSAPPPQEAEIVAAGAIGSSDPEPLPLARKIQSLLSNLPPFLSFETPADTPDGTPKQGGNTPTTPDAPAPIPDSSLLSLLSSPSIMNGSLSRGRQSVWAMLDNLRLKTLKSGADAGTTPASDVAEGAESVLEDDDSVMFYGPLIPDANSSVELARSEIVSVDENGTIVEVLLDDAPPPHASRPPSTDGVDAEKFKWPWPFNRSPPAPPPKPKTVEKRLWVPSTDKLSLQVMWWGYRLWLPPPVLAMLNDKEMEAAKLGAMLTTALQWLLNHVPESALPPTLRPALSLVKSLVPYLGYIGGFVAWSWTAIRGFDKGYGVTLTATWLLPIALVPGTWEEKDVPKPPATSNPSSPSSDPSTSNPSAPPASAPGTGDPSPAIPSSPTSGTVQSSAPGILTAQA